MKEFTPMFGKQLKTQSRRNRFQQLLNVIALSSKINFMNFHYDKKRKEKKSYIKGNVSLKSLTKKCKTFFCSKEI